MKKLLILPALAMFLVSVAWAAPDGAAIYKSSCAGCHGPAGEKGDAPLKDLSADDALQKLRGYADGSYGGAKKTVMQNVVKKHKDELKEIADYIGTL